MAGPSWHHRRRLIYSTYVLSALMILFGAFTYRTDSQVSTQLIVGGVSLITIILTAYTAFATLDDKWHFKPEDAKDSTHPSQEVSDED
jgi:hypothetical protein